MADFQYTIKGSDGTEKVEGDAFNVSDNNTLTVTANGGEMVAMFNGGQWSSVKAKKMADAKNDELDQGNTNRTVKFDGGLTRAGLDSQQNYAEHSAAGENPTLGNPDQRAINGDVKTGEDEDDKGDKKPGRAKAR